MISYKNIDVGDEVYWTGSENGRDTIYTVLAKYEDDGRSTILIIGDGYSEFEVFLSELY